MRRCSVKAMRRAQLRGVLWLLAASLLAGGLWLDRYVNTVIKPTLHELAEYEARAATVQAVNRAVAAALAADASLTDALFVQSGGIVSLDAAAAGAAQLRRVSAVQEEMNVLPEEDFTIPFGSLTNNSLLSGLGPGWRMQVQPKGYAEGHIREATESLSINTTRYSAVLQLSVTVNMILDGSRHADRIRRLPIGKCADRRRYPERLRRDLI